MSFVQVAPEPADGESGPDWAEAAAGSTATPAVTGLQPDTTYWIRVAARNGAGDGPWSETLIASTQPVVTKSAGLAAPALVSSTGGRLCATWGTPSDLGGQSESGITGFELYVSTAAGSNVVTSACADAAEGALSGQCTVAATTTVDPDSDDTSEAYTACVNAAPAGVLGIPGGGAGSYNLAASQMYGLRVAAITSEGGRGLMSSPAFVSTGELSTPTAPGTPTVEFTTGTSVRIRFDAADDYGGGEVLTAEVEVVVAGDGEAEPVYVNQSAVTNPGGGPQLPDLVTLDDLLTDVDYDIRVRAWVDPQVS